jgi:hypothetical protein
MVVNAVSGEQGVTVDTSSVSAKTEDSFSSYMNQTSLEDLFEKASQKYGVDVNLLKAVAKAESGFDASCTSSSGAKGIMQLMPSTAASLGVTDVYDPEQNIMGGAKLLSSLLDKYDGNVSLALAGYNAGVGNVKKYGGIPPFKETQDYVVKVTKYMNEGVTVPNQTVYTTSSSDGGSTGTADVSAASVQTQSVQTAQTEAEETDASQVSSSQTDAITPYTSYSAAQYQLGLVGTQTDQIDTQDLVVEEILEEISEEEEAERIFSEEDYETFLESLDENADEFLEQTLNTVQQLYSEYNGINYSPNVMNLIVPTLATSAMTEEDK